MAKKSDPARSEGARYERAAMRKYLRRELRSLSDTDPARDFLEAALKYVLTREARYSKRPGGL